jgi:hypothetical protein
MLVAMFKKFTVINVPLRFFIKLNFNGRGKNFQNTYVLKIFYMGIRDILLFYYLI